MTISKSLHSRLLYSSLSALVYAPLSYACLQFHISTNICFSFTFVLVLSYFYSLPCMQRPAFMQTSFFWNTNTTGFHTNYTWTCISGSACSHCVTNQKKRVAWENTYISTGHFVCCLRLLDLCEPDFSLSSYQTWLRLCPVRCTKSETT